MKLSGLTYISFGVAVAIIALSYALFMHFAPNRTEAGYWRTQRDALEVEANKLPAAKKKLETAKVEVAEKIVQWNAIAVARTPSESLATGGINLAVNPWQLTVDARAYRNSVQRAVNAQLRKGGVEIVQGPSVPFPDEDPRGLMANYFNYPAMSFPIVIFDLGQVTVRGNYNQIMSHVRSFAGMPNYLAVTDGLALQGTSPNLTATYNLQIVGFMRSKNIFQMPEGAGGSASSGGNFAQFGGPGPGGAGPGDGGGGRPMAAGLQGGGGPTAAAGR
jgi:hypothetical protein